MNFSFFYKIFFILFVITKVSMVKGQVTKNKIEIQEIEIDNILKEKVLAYIKKYKEKNTLFANGIGFISIKNFEISLNSGKPFDSLNFTKTSSSQFDIDIYLYPLLPNEHSNCVFCNYFPSYYSIIDNTLILIYDTNIEFLLGRKSQNDLKTQKYYKKTSKKRLLKLVYSFSLKNLPKNYIFDWYLGDVNKNLAYYKKKFNSKYKKYIPCEFINFNAHEVIKVEN